MTLHNDGLDSPMGLHSTQCYVDKDGPATEGPHTTAHHPAGGRTLNITNDVITM